MRTLGLSFTKLLVKDMEAAADFYNRGLSLTVLPPQFAGEGELAQELRLVSTTTNPEDGKLVLSRYLHRAAPEPGSAWIAFLVEDIDATIESVATAGGKIVKPAADEPGYGIRAAIVSDPEGHVIELTQMLAST